MKRYCPACQREFDEAGFCPFDGTALSERDVSKPTVLSAFVDAQMPPFDTKLPTEPDLRRDNDPTNRVRAISAAAATHDALDSMRKRTEYDSLVGDTLDGRYFIKAKIGEGGMGVVFAARHAVIERPLAIKVLKREVMRDTATIRRFVQEAKAASRIGHPNIVDVTDFGTTPEGMTYSVMEFVDGTTLSKAIKHGAPFPAERAIRIASQIARALGAAHDKGIVHRDLKPENVFLVDREGRTDFVKIVDFGIAKVTPLDGQTDGPRLTRVGSVFGTPEYMAPEQAAGRSDTDGRVDIYALGTILYEMLCGRVPHKSDSMIRTIAMQMLDDIPLLSKAHPEIEIAPELEGVVMRALAKKREDRYQTMADLLIALERVYDSVTAAPTREDILKSLPPLPPGADPIPLATDGLATAATAVPTVRRIRHEPQFVTSDRPLAFDHLLADQSQPVRRSRWPIALAVVVLAGGAAVGAVLLMRGRNPTVAIVERDAALARDATVAHDAAIDAALVVLAPDAAIAPRPAPDAGIVVIDTPNHRGTIDVQVFTKPDTAKVYVAGHLRGESGIHVEQPYGDRIAIECRQPGYQAGKVVVVFDGKQEKVQCELARIKRCVPGLKNPFDNCPPDDP